MGFEQDSITKTRDVMPKSRSGHQLLAIEQNDSTMCQLER
jgi:hypothetical protein